MKASKIIVRDPQPGSTSTSAIIHYEDSNMSPAETPIDGWGDLAQKVSNHHLDIRDRTVVEMSDTTERWLRDLDGHPPDTTTVDKV